MAQEIVVPELGESVVEATVAAWLKDEGDEVRAGEALVSLETDKVDLDVPATQTGVLLKIQKQAGEDVAVGDVLALIEVGQQRGDSNGADQVDGESDDQKNAPAAGEPATPSQDNETATVSIKSDGTTRAVAEDGERATPVARRMAEEKGVDLADVRGEGPGGRVTKHDVEAFLAQSVDTEGERPDGEVAAPQDEVPAQKRTGSVSPVAEEAPAASVSGDRDEERVRMSRRRRTIAERLVGAQQTAAILTTFNEVDMSAVMEMRKRKRDEFKEKYGVSLGFMSYFVKASIGALRRFPEVNAAIDDNDLVYRKYYDIGIAVGAEEGLVVPVLRDADRMSFATIEQSISAVVEKARTGSLALDDLRGGTFTISNGGVYGSLLSTPILNPPQVGILGLHKIEQRPVVVENEIVIRPMMYVALSYDHRVVDGKEAVQFLGTIKSLIEDPEELLLAG